MQGAWKVGLLVVVFFVLLIGAYQILGKSLFRPETDTYYIRIPDAAGVNQGSNVTMAGVRIGEVTEVELADQRTARLTIAVQRDYMIPEGTRAMLTGSLIGFGDTPVELVAPLEPAPQLAPGSTIEGARASALSASLPELETTVTELNKTLVAVREFIADNEMKEDVSNLIKNAAKTLDEFGKLAAGAQRLIADNRGSVEKAMGSLAMAMEDVRKTAKLAASMVGDPRFQQDAKDLVASLNRTTLEAEKLVTNLNAVVTDPQIRNPMTASAANVEKITESGTRIAANTEEITRNGIAISKNVEELTKKASDLADEAKSVLQKLQQFFERVPGKSSVAGLTAEMNLLRETDPDRWRTDVEGSLPVADGHIYFGIFDAFESNKLTLQYGKPFAPGSSYRYGIYASKPGLGVDYRLAQRLYLRGDLYDINNLRLDVRTRYEFGNGLIGWLGLQDAFQKNAIVAGLGIRR